MTDEAKTENDAAPKVRGRRPKDDEELYEVSKPFRTAVKAQVAKAIFEWLNNAAVATIKKREAPVSALALRAGAKRVANSSKRGRSAKRTRTIDVVPLASSPVEKG